MNRPVARVIIQACLILSTIIGGVSGAPTVSTPHVARKSRSTLRVGFWTLWHDRQAELAPAGATTFRTCATCSAAPLRESATVRVEGMSGLAVTTRNITIRTRKLMLNGAVKITAHGESELLRSPVAVSARNGVLIFTVTSPIESYVERVLESESGPDDSLESLKALAVAVRTFALHEQHGHPDYDVCDSTHCQLLHWGGVPQRQSAAHRATLETSGETLWFQDQPALAYFTRDCGGQSASLHQVWPRAASKDYLGSRADTYCSRTPSKEWTSDATRAELSNSLARRGLVVPGWQHLHVEERSGSGRVITVQLDSTVLPAEDFRIAVGESLGWNRLQSNWFEINEVGDHYYFRGRGAGHGVGLCQKGAAVMASQGRTAAEILAQYFHGSYVADEGTGRRWRTLPGSGFVLQSSDSSDVAFIVDLARARAEASQRSGLNTNTPIVVRAFASTSAFRDATLAPGWVAGFTEGDWVAIQPLSILSERHLLADTLRHEFLHALVESQARADTPLWIREGLVEVWSADPARTPVLRARQPVMPPGELDSALHHLTTEAQSRTAHLDAATYAQQMLDRHGRDLVLSWLRSGVPADVLLRIGHR